MKFHIGDTVKITAGKDKGREGKIEQILLKGSAALVPGVNIYKKHIKASQAVDKKGGIYDIPRPLGFGKLAIICPNCKKVTRVGFRIEGDKQSLDKSKKVRFCKKCDRNLETKKG